MSYRDDPQGRKLTREAILSGKWECRECGGYNDPDDTICWGCHKTKEETNS